MKLVVAAQPLRAYPSGTTMQAVNERSAGPQNASKSQISNPEIFSVDANPQRAAMPVQIGFGTLGLTPRL
jgi:hypothetical protein